MLAESTARLTSEDIARSVNTNASRIRMITSLLQNAGLLARSSESRALVLNRPREEITLLDVYAAVAPKPLINTHHTSNTQCPVGSTINAVLDPLAAAADAALERELSAHTLDEVIEAIRREHVARTSRP